MEITWYGHSCFRLVERGKAVIITDPFSDAIGFKLPALKSDIVSVSHDAPGHNHSANVKGYQRVLSSPGEYEIGGVYITAIALNNTESTPPKRNVGFLFDFDGLKVMHLGDLDHVPPQAIVEALGTVHIALVPVGGGGALSASLAAEVISLLEPSIVIPMHFKTDQNALELETAERFLKEMGVTRAPQDGVYKVSLSSLPEQTQVIILNPVS